jgi:hypothetical protein
MTDSALNEGATIENALHTHELHLGGWMLFVIWLILFIIGRKPSRIPNHSRSSRVVTAQKQVPRKAQKNR